MKIDINELIHTQVTRPQIPIEDDGVGNYNISPMGFPFADRSKGSNPTLFKPEFIMASNAHQIATNVALSGLQGYVDGDVVKLNAQTDPSQNGKYIVRVGVWDKFVEYAYDGTENDNKAGLYDGVDQNGNSLNHYRKGYSHAEVASFLREKLHTSINFGKFKGKTEPGNGSLYNWFVGGGKVNIGGSRSNESVFVDSFASMTNIGGKVRNEFPIETKNNELVSELKQISVNENRSTKWSLSNHHTEALKGRNKSPFVRDYPFKYNSSHIDGIFSGGMLPIEARLDDWRISVQGYSTPNLRPLCDESLYYQRDNGYHNNITIDMTNPNMFGRQHLSILHHLDRADVAPNIIDQLGNGTTYDVYHNDLLKFELDILANKMVDGHYYLVSNTVGGITKYYYKQRKKNSVSITQIGPWSPTNLLWNTNGDGGISVYISESTYIDMKNGSQSVEWMVKVLNENNQLIPMPFTLPIDEVDRNEYLNTLDVLFVNNSIIDHTQEVHRSEKIRSKKTFVHLPTSVDLVDGQQFELDVSLPMISEQEAFKYNTLGSLSGYMNFVTQPRVYVFSGSQTCYSSNNYIKNNLKINAVTLNSNVITLTSNNHGITDTSITLYISSKSNSVYNGFKQGVVINANTIQFPITATVVPSDLFISWMIKITDVEISGLSVNGGVVTLNTATQHGVLDAEDVLISISGASTAALNGQFRAMVVDYNTFAFNASIDDVVDSGTPKITKIIVSHNADDNDGVDGLTERKNQYMFSVMPEVEGATQLNVYHQRKLELSDIKSSDKRVLIASVYPTSTNTFAWKINNDPQMKMLRQNIMAPSSVFGSAAYQGYCALKTAYDKVSGKMGASTMSLYDSPISYVESKITGSSDSFESFLSARIRVLMPENIVPSTDQILSKNEAATFGSFVYQARAAYNECLDAFYSTRVGYSNTRQLGSAIGFNDNGSHSDDLGIGSFASLLSFDPLKTTKTASSNLNRWITKAIYTSEKSQKLTGYTAFPADDVFATVSPEYKAYLSSNFMSDDELETNSGDRYIPGQLNSPIDPRFRFGSGYKNSIEAYLINSGASQSTVNDFNMSLADWCSTIPEAAGSIDYRDFSTRFMLNGAKVNKASMANFYGMYSLPFARVFGDGIIPCDGELTSMRDYATIRTNIALTTTLISAISSNPVLGNYLVNGMDEGVSLNTRNSNPVIQGYLRNHVVGYANSAPIRFYNSFRIGVFGNVNDLTSTSFETTRIYNHSIRNYVADYIETLPSALYGKYIDDNFTLTKTNNHIISVVDVNDSHLYFSGRGVSATGKITITDWSVLLSSNSRISINGVIFTPTISTTPEWNQFRVYESNIETANSIVAKINSCLMYTLDTVIADNYSGMSNKITLTINQSIGAAGNSYSLTMSGSGIEMEAFSGGADKNTDSLNNLIAVAGNPYIASKEFYSRNMRHSYVRVKMRFVFSSSCGRWLTMDYRQTPITFLTPSFGNEALAYKEKTIVKPGTSGMSSSDYISLLSSQVAAHKTKDYLWNDGRCYSSDDAYKALWCVPYAKMTQMELNRFSLPFLANSFPYDDSGKLISTDHKGALNVPVDFSQYRFGKLQNPVSNIRMVVPNNVHGGKIVNSIDTSDKTLNTMYPNLWSVYWHMRPATTALDGCDIPSKTSRVGGSASDPTLHNMFTFPCKHNVESEPCYLIPWHEDMNYDWLMNSMTSIDAKIMSDVERKDKMDIDADFERLNGVIVDVLRSDFLEIESDRIQS